MGRRSRFRFISLYNSSLFQWDLSEQVLNLLTQTTFTEGLVAGVQSASVPSAGVSSGTLVAHKFGENSATTSDGTVVRELHDCGIVYYPSNPYLLCVMTKGSDFVALQNVISGISNLVYRYSNGKTL